MVLRGKVFVLTQASIPMPACICVWQRPHIKKHEAYASVGETDACDRFNSTGTVRNSCASAASVCVGMRASV